MASGADGRSSSLHLVRLVFQVQPVPAAGARPHPAACARLLDALRAAHHARRRRPPRPLRRFVLVLRTEAYLVEFDLRSKAEQSRSGRVGRSTFDSTTQYCTVVPPHVVLCSPLLSSPARSGGHRVELLGRARVRAAHRPRAARAAPPAAAAVHRPRRALSHGALRLPASSIRRPVLVSEVN